MARERENPSEEPEDDEDDDHYRRKMTTGRKKSVMASIAETRNMRKRKSTTTIQGAEAEAEAMNLVMNPFSNYPHHPNFVRRERPATTLEDLLGSSNSNFQSQHNVITPWTSSSGLLPFSSMPLPQYDLTSLQRPDLFRPYYLGLNLPTTYHNNIEGDKDLNSSKKRTLGCPVEGCYSDFSNCGDYYKRRNVCEVHSKTPEVKIDGHKLRFCQKCTRFHPLGEFDSKNKSCRQSLYRHNLNRKRRKTQPQPVHLTRPPNCFTTSFQGGSNVFPWSINPLLNHPHRPIPVYAWSGLSSSSFLSQHNVLTPWMSNFLPSSPMNLPQHDFSSLRKTDLSAPGFRPYALRQQTPLLQNQEEEEEEEEDVRGFDLNKPPPNE